MNGTTGRVGIVIPTLGSRPLWLAEAVASVDMQGAGVDLVLVAPPDAVSGLRAQFPGQRVIGEAEAGIAPAIETGWRALDDCDVLSWLGDDDQLTRHSVPTALRYLLARRRRASMVYGDYEYVGADGQRTVTVRPGRLAPRWLRVGQNFIAQPGCLYTRDAIEGSGGLSRTLKLAFDAELHLRLSDGAVYCPVTLAKVRVHGSRLTTAECERSLAEFRTAIWNGADSGGHRALLSRCQPIWRIGGRCYYRMRRSYA